MTVKPCAVLLMAATCLSCSGKSVRSAKMGLIAGECATVVFDSSGRLITVCSDFFEMAL